MDSVFFIFHALFRVGEGDAININQSKSVARILDLIEYGSLTLDETKRRLESIVQQEIDRTDGPADIQLVNACEELLRLLNTNGIMVYDRHIESNWAVVMKRQRVRHRRKSVTKHILRIAIFAAAVFVLAIVGDGIFNREWLSHRSTDDQQQYVIQGQAVDPGLVPDGSAGHETEPSDLTTADLQEAIAFLGFQPDMPAWLPVGWEAKHFYVSIGEGNKRFNVSYVPKSGEKGTLLYETRTFSDTQNAYASFEQNTEGESLDVDGEVIYFMQNDEKLSCIWQEGLIIYTLSGSVSLDEMKNIITSIGGRSTS